MDLSSEFTEIAKLGDSDVNNFVGAECFVTGWGVFARKSLNKALIEENRWLSGNANYNYIICHISMDHGESYFIVSHYMSFQPKEVSACRIQ